MDTVDSVSCKQITQNFINISINSISKANIYKSMETDSSISDSVLKLKRLENKLNSVVTDREDSNIVDTSICKIKTPDARALLESFKNEEPNKINKASTGKKTAVFQDLQVEKSAYIYSNELLSSSTIIPQKKIGGKYAKIVLLADETFQGLQEHWPANAAAPDWIYRHRLKLLEIKSILEEYCLINLPRGGKLFVIAMVRFEEKLAYIPSSACKKLWEQHPIPMKEVTTVDVANPYEQFVAVINSIKGLPCAEIDLVFTPVVPSNLCKIQEKLIYTHAKLTKHRVTTPEVTTAAYKSCLDYMRDCLKLNKKLGNLCLTQNFSSFTKWKIFAWEMKVFQSGNHFDPDSIPLQRNGRYMVEEILADTAFQLCTFINQVNLPSKGCKPLPMQHMQKMDGQKGNNSKCTFSEIVFLLDPKLAEFAKYWPSNFPLKTSFELTAHKLCPTEVKELIRHKYQGDDILFIHCPSVKSLLQIKQLDECKDHLKLKYPACQNGLDSSLYCNKFLSQLKLLRSLLQEDFPDSTVCFTTLHCVDFAKFIPNLIIKHANATAHCCKNFFKNYFISQHNDCFHQAVAAINKGIISLNYEAVPISFDVCEFMNTGKVDRLFNGLHLNESALQIFSENLLLSLRKCNVQSLKTASMAIQTATSRCNQSKRLQSPSLNKQDSTLRRQSLKTEKYSCQKPKTSHMSSDIPHIQDCPSGSSQDQSLHLLKRLNLSSPNLMSRLGERPSQTTDILSGSLNMQGQSPLHSSFPPMFNRLSVRNQTLQLTDQLLLSNSRSSPRRHLSDPMGTRSPPTRSRSPPTRSRSPPTRSRSPPTRSRSPPTRSRSPPTRSRSPPTRSRSPPTRSRSSATPSQSSSNRRTPPERRFLFHVDDRTNSSRKKSSRKKSSHSGNQMQKRKKKTRKHESNTKTNIATPHHSVLGKMSTDNDPNTRRALRMLSKIHRKECATYRSQPHLHPDYKKEKALFFDMTNSCLDKPSRPSMKDMTKQFEDFWRKRMEEIFQADWEEKKNNCSAMIARDTSHTTQFEENVHLVGSEKLPNFEELPRVESGLLLKSMDNASYGTYTNTELLRKIDAVLKKSEIVLNKDTTNIDLVKAGHEKGSFTESRFIDHNHAALQCAQENFVPKFYVGVGHLSPVSVKNGKEGGDPRIPNSATALPIHDSSDVIESLKILSQMHDQFGRLSLPLSMILNTAIAAQINKRDVLHIFADQERDVLKLCLQKLTELRASNMSFVQKVIIDEAFDRLEKLLLCIQESQDPMFGIDVKELSREVKNLDPSKAIARIKHIVVSKGFSSVKDGQILKIYMTLKSQDSS